MDALDTEIKQLKRSMRTATPDERQAKVKRIEEIQDNMPAPPDGLQSMTDDMEHKASIHLLARGDYQNKGDAVGMRPPGVLLPDSAPELAPETGNSRSMLAKWVINPENPLTARVMVNRIWQHHFGRGLVGTPGDFGNRGDAPTHPDVLLILRTPPPYGGGEMIGRQLERLFTGKYEVLVFHRPRHAGPARGRFSIGNLAFGLRFVAQS